MPLTRKLLKGMGLTDEQVDTIIEAHTDVVDGLKDELAESKKSAARLAEVEKELNDIKANGDGGYKEKYEKEHTDFEAYKAEIAGKETQAQKTNVFRKLLEKANISKAHIETLIDTKTAEKLINELEIKDGKAVDEDKVSKAISDTWGGYVEHTENKPTGAANPPSNTGGGTKTVSEIMAIKDGAARRKAIAENLSLFEGTPTAE